MNDRFTVCCLKGEELQFVNIFTANKVAMLYSVDLLQYVSLTVLLKLFRLPKAANTSPEGSILPRTVLENPT